MGAEVSSVQGVGYGLRCRSIGICRSHFVCECILPHGIPAISQNGLHASNPTGIGGRLSSKRDIDDGRETGLGRARALLLVPIETVGRKDADQDRCEEEDDQDRITTARTRTVHFRNPGGRRSRAFAFLFHFPRSSDTSNQLSPPRISLSCLSMSSVGERPFLSPAQVIGSCGTEVSPELGVGFYFCRPQHLTRACGRCMIP